MSSALDTTKDVITILRESAIILLILLFVVFPTLTARWMAAYAERLSSAGKEKGAQVEVNTGLAKYTFNNTTNVLTSLTTASKATDDAIQGLDKLKSEGATPQMIAKINQIQDAQRLAQQQVTNGITSAQDIQLKSYSTIQSQPDEAKTGGSYGIQVATDRLQHDAEGEVRSLKERHFDDIAVYKQQALYRTVARFPDKVSANQQIQSIREYRPTAFLVDLSTICKSPSPSNETLDGVTVTGCQP